MLEFLKFSIGGYFGGDTNVVVNVVDGIASVSVESKPYPEQNGIKMLTQETGDKWLAELAEFHIGGWKSLYELEDQVLDGESWTLEYKEQNKRCRHISGQNAYPKDWQKFIDLMDEISPMVSPIQIDLLRMQYTKMELVPIDGQMDMGESSYLLQTDESILLNRYEETISLGVKSSLGNDVMTFWHVPGGIPALMDRCQVYLEDMTSQPSEFESDVPSYELTIGYHDGTGTVIKGLFKKNDLPAGWSELAEDVVDFIWYYDMQPMMLQPIGPRTAAGPNDYIYCSVNFSEDGKTYYYQTDDSTLEVGDTVIVPVGPENREMKVCIVKVEYFTANELPMPSYLVKTIVRKVDRIGE